MRDRKGFFKQMGRTVSDQIEKPVHQLVQDLMNLGVVPGSAVMVHASLRAIGPVEGRANGVLEALDIAVGSEGGVLMVLGSFNEWAWEMTSLSTSARRCLLMRFPSIC